MAVPFQEGWKSSFAMRLKVIDQAKVLGVSVFSMKC